VVNVCVFSFCGDECMYSVLLCSRSVVLSLQSYDQSFSIRLHFRLGGQSVKREKNMQRKTPKARFSASSESDSSSGFEDQPQRKRKRCVNVDRLYLSPSLFLSLSLSLFRSLPPSPSLSPVSLPITLTLYPSLSLSPSLSLFLSLSTQLNSTHTHTHRPKSPARSHAHKKTKHSLKTHKAWTDEEKRELTRAAGQAKYRLLPRACLSSLVLSSCAFFLCFLFRTC
jgi:hypothetical protein